MGLSFEKLRGDNYPEWKFNMKMLLLERGLFGFVDNTEPAPADDAPIQEKLGQMRRKQRALATICLGVEEDQKNLLVQSENAKDAWEALI